MAETRSIGGYTFQSKPPRERVVERRKEENEGRLATPPPESTQEAEDPELAESASREFLQVPCGVFEYEDHTADIRIKSEGSTVGSCLKALGLGLFNYMTDISKINERKCKTLTVAEDNLAGFIFHFLDELLGFYGEEYFMVSRIEISSLVLEPGNYLVEAVCFGEKFNQSAHTQGTEVKAITMHDLCIEDTPEKVTITVLVDI